MCFFVFSPSLTVSLQPEPACMLSFFVLRHPFDVYVTSVFPLRRESCSSSSEESPRPASFPPGGSAPLCFSLKPLAATEPLGSFSNQRATLQSIPQLCVYVHFNGIYSVAGRRFHNTALTREWTQWIAGSAGRYNVFFEGKFTGGKQRWRRSHIRSTQEKAALV